MRFVVQTKNLVMGAVALQRLPWVSVLDAYDLARLRPDAHPGPRRSIGHKDDCLHYCLPGIPDVFNGRLLTLMHEHLDARRAAAAAAGGGVGSAAVAAVAAAVASVMGSERRANPVATPAATPGYYSPGGLRALGAPGAMLDRWNFDYAGEPFVQGSPPWLSLRLRTAAAPSVIECPVRATGADGPLGTMPLVGVCSDMQ